MKEAQLYISLEDQKVQCQLCAHNCLILEGKFGFCAVRQNIKGVLYAHNYGKLVAANIDPVEKKPLYHFFPAHQVFRLPAPDVISVAVFARTGRSRSWILVRIRSRGLRWIKDQRSLFLTREKLSV